VVVEHVLYEETKVIAEMVVVVLDTMVEDVVVVVVLTNHS
jgi:hypothetical protein